MKISMKVVADFEFHETGPVLHCDVQAEIDGDGPDVIELERMSGEHQRQMARDAHEFMQAAGPVIMQIIAGLNGRPASPDSDPEGLDVPGYGRELLEHAARLNRLEQQLPAGWSPDAFVHMETGATMFKAGEIWQIYGRNGENFGEGYTIAGALLSAGDRFSPDFEEA